MLVIAVCGVATIASSALLVRRSCGLEAGAPVRRVEKSYLGMEAPARGMLRRPIGLLASTTTRASRAPDVMGSVAMPGAEQAGCGSTGPATSWRARSGSTE